MESQNGNPGLEQLKRFPEISNFYWLRNLPENLLQGDGWRGFVAIDFYRKQEKVVSGVILSNSCDINSDNPRYHDVKILFAPLIRLSSFARLVKTSGKTDDQIATLLDSIRKQLVSFIFYLPEIPSVVEESIVLLDDVHAHPLKDFLNRDRTRLFTLSNYAFYLFILKLSVHLCRFQEGLSRSA
jgi:hypothetical protein